MTRQREKKLEEKRIRLEKKEAKRGNAQILLLTYSITIIFLALIVYFSYFMVTKSQKIINNPYNKRQEVMEKKVIRGSIKSSDGKVLAKTETDKNGQDKRVYPYDKVFCHVVGRLSNSMTGLEKEYCYPLLTSHANPVSQLVDTFKGEKSPGDDLITTLDAELQETAYEALGDHKGAIVAMEPSTGKILAMVSKPAYNPNKIEQNWEELVQASSANSKLINRATQGLYPPGSTFKILTAIEYIRENPDTYEDYRYECKGTDSFSGNVINCYDKEKHGTLDLKSAFAKSCNGAFAEIGTKIDADKLHKLAESFRFNQRLPVEFENNQSKFNLTGSSDMGELTQTVIGQGKTLITPLENALIVSTIANNGVMMKPYVVDHLENADGEIQEEEEPKELGTVVEPWVAQKMTQYMKAVVNKGTGTALKGMSMSVAGKTGSAEFDSQGTSHAWFVGFAPASNPDIVVSIVVEGAGTGSQYAVPIARKMLECYLED